ncbi:MAG: glutathione S-transferase family protein [Polyangiales bacterium]
MTELVLHHYDASPFGRKVRAALGYKNLAWRSAEVAMQPPRPSLATLAGGYRRIPVLQVGADVFCDTNLILRVLDVLHPEPPLRPAHDALTVPVSQFYEPRLFQHFSPLRFRTREDAAGAFGAGDDRAAFLQDRAGFMAPMLDVGKNRDNVQTCAAHARLFTGWLEGLLADGRAYLQGDAPTHADFSAWHPLHWLRGYSAHRDFLSDFTRVWAWVERVAALGEGTRTPITAAEALTIAREAAPSFRLPEAPMHGDPAVGARVRVAPVDYGVDPVEGTLSSIGADHVSVARAPDETGDVRVHFPRWGYRVDAI